MQFSEFISHYGDFGRWILPEVADVASMDTSHINLEGEKFDEDKAERECSDQVDRYWDGGDYYDDIYDDPDDDPHFDAESPDDWATDHPEPVRGDFETEEEYSAAHLKWEEEYSKIQQSYEDAVSEWEEEMERRRDRASEAEWEARQEEVSNCVQEKRQKWESQAVEYRYSFQYDDDDYEVTFSKESAFWGGWRIENIWEVVFEGPEGTSTTNKGHGAATVYQHLILAVKRLLETVRVDGLSFIPAEPGMALVYERFYRNFLSRDDLPCLSCPNDGRQGMVRTSRSLYVRRWILEMFKSRMSPEQRADFEARIKQGEEELQANLANIRRQKSELRQKRMLAQRLVGKLVGWRDIQGRVHPAIVKGYEDRYGIRYQLVAWLGYLDQISADEESVVSPVGLDPMEVRQLMAAMRQFQPEVIKLPGYGQAATGLGAASNDNDVTGVPSGTQQ